MRIAYSKYKTCWKNEFFFLFMLFKREFFVNKKGKKEAKLSHLPFHRMSLFFLLFFTSHIFSFLFSFQKGLWNGGVGGGRTHKVPFIEPLCVCCRKWYPIIHRTRLVFGLRPCFSQSILVRKQDELRPHPSKRPVSLVGAICCCCVLRLSLASHWNYGSYERIKTSSKQRHH